MSGGAMLPSNSARRRARDAARAPMAPHAARRLLVGCVVVTFALYQLPYGGYVVYPLLLISTLVHELGHGAVAIVAGGDFVAFRMAADGSGVAYHSGVGGVARGLVAAGGLCGPALCAAVMLAGAARPRPARALLGGFGAALALVAALVVRGGFGLAFTAAVAAIALGLALGARGRTVQAAVVVLAVQLGLSVYARRDYLFTASVGAGDGVRPSDTQQMALALGGSYRLWGVACALFSIAMLAIGAAIYWRATRDARAGTGPR